MTDYNIYCDESCHLERDDSQVMVLGALMCPTRRARSIASALRGIKQRHNMGHDRPWTFEVKWSKVSNAAYLFYQEYVDYLFDCDDLSFRGLVVRDKSQLRHGEFGQTHDEWYYKMFYQALQPLLNPNDRYRIYLDIKDSLAQQRVLKLREVLNYRLRDFNQDVVTRIQQVRSDEVEQIQLVDLFIGAIGYLNRGLSDNEGKTRLVRHIQERSGLTLKYTTGRNRPKVNLFFWDAREIANA